MNMGGIVKTLRHGNSLFFHRHSIFSAEGPFRQYRQVTNAPDEICWSPQYVLTPLIHGCLGPGKHGRAWTGTINSCKAQRKHIDLSYINFLAPTLNTPSWPCSRKKLLCLVSWEECRKGAHKNSFGGIWGSKHRRFLATKSLVYALFPALMPDSAQSSA